MVKWRSYSQKYRVSQLDNLVDVLYARRRLVLSLRRRVELAGGGLVGAAHHRLWEGRGDRRVKFALPFCTTDTASGLRPHHAQPFGADPLVEPPVEFRVMHVILCHTINCAPLDDFAVTVFTLTPLASQPLTDLD